MILSACSGVTPTMRMPSSRSLARSRLRLRLARLAIFRNGQNATLERHLVFPRIGDLRPL